MNGTEGLNTFKVDKPHVSSMYEVAFLAGQPLGYYGSWSLFSLSHHYLVWLAAQIAEPDRVTPFQDYAILGDDVVIASYPPNTCSFLTNSMFPSPIRHLYYLKQEPSNLPISFGLRKCR